MDRQQDLTALADELLVEAEGSAHGRAGDEQWHVGAGEMVPIAQARHSVEVPDEPTVLLLTVAID